MPFRAQRVLTLGWFLQAWIQNQNEFQKNNTCACRWMSLTTVHILCQASWTTRPLFANMVLSLRISWCIREIRWINSFRYNLYVLLGSNKVYWNLVGDNWSYMNMTAVLKWGIAASACVGIPTMPSCSAISCATFHANFRHRVHVYHTDQKVPDSYWILQSCVKGVQQEMDSVK